MLITGRFRDASGDFGCPNCWGSGQTFQRISPEVNPTNCPHCGVDLKWSAEDRKYSKSFKEKPRLGRRQVADDTF